MKKKHQNQNYKGKRAVSTGKIRKKNDVSKKEKKKERKENYFFL